MLKQILDEMNAHWRRMNAMWWIVVEQMMTMRVMETSTNNGRIAPPSLILAPPSRTTVLAPPSSQAAPRLAAPPPPLRLLLRPPSLLLLLDLLLLKQGVLLAAVTVHPTIVLAHLRDLLDNSSFRLTFQSPHLMFWQYWAGHRTAANTESWKKRGKQSQTRKRNRFKADKIFLEICFSKTEKIALELMAWWLNDLKPEY